jgi:hypothetical protein
MVFGFCITASIWAICLYTLQVLYGTTKITKLTAVPYYFFALAMLSTAIECCLLGTEFNTINELLSKAPQETGTKRNYFNCTADIRQTGPTVFWSNRLFKLLLYALFVLVVTAQM